MGREALAGPRPGPEKLGHSFFERSAEEVAPDLIGKVLVHRVNGQAYRARVVETEAYLGPQDLASHASKGRTGRTEVLFGPSGRAYVYLIYGMHDMLNIVTGAPGEAHAVLIRGAEPLDGWKANLSGPGRLARGMQITRAENAIDVTGDVLYFEDNPGYTPSLVVTKRIGIDYAKEWKDAPLRFLDAEHPLAVRHLARTDGVAEGPPSGLKPPAKGRPRRRRGDVP